MREFVEILKVIFIGIVEGITEWLPISSTGHMILADELVSLDVSDEFMELFLVVIQLGAVMAIPVVFWKRLFPFSKDKSPGERCQVLSLWFKVIVGVIPAGVLGILLDDFYNEHFYNYVVVDIALIAYGVAFILIERFKKDIDHRIDDVYDITYRDALIIGAYQTLSLIPGTSRSGSTILGGMLHGVSRTAAAEFSFFLAIPVMLGASGLKVVKLLLGGYAPTSFELALLGIGILVAFLVSLVAVKFLMSFVKNHTFRAFGIYRIALGVVVLGYFLTKTLI